MLYRKPIKWTINDIWSNTCIVGYAAQAIYVDWPNVVKDYTHRCAVRMVRICSILDDYEELIAKV